ncbi:ORC-CDC6 family AAA ATPase [Lysobacter sp. 22409]|uniref:ORC-CDC6 family AAA ATPase n=1 Tax=Lysobacter sp. 22409 TaxID=3453917 RepID=UPI003F832A29
MKHSNVFGEHYNARGLSPEMIASSFVPPAQFLEVASRGHCVLVGPRGSGKTTLLRMLDPRALHAWRHGADEGMPSPSYVGIFVPIDTAWVSALTNAIKSLDGARTEAAYLAVYALSIASALIDVMRWRISPESKRGCFHISSDRIDEESLAQKLAGLWMPEKKVRSLLELRVAIATEIATLPRKWSDSARRDSELSFGHLNPLELTAAACEIFNLLSGDEGRKWALLCDELEIAPDSIQQVLFAGLRAAPSPLLLKYALTPKQRIPFAQGSERPLPANDYDVISLSYATREEGAPEREREEFCVALWRSLVMEVCPAQASLLDNPFAVLENPNASGRKERREHDDLDAKFGGIFRELAQKDETFRRYVVSKGVVLGNLNQTEQKVRDSVVRKVRALAEIRNLYLSLDAADNLKKISRRTLAPYCGAERIFAVSEGHPRWLKYTLASMLSYVSVNDRIKVADQNRELEHSIQRIEARIKALPAENMSTYDLVGAIGLYFREQILGKQFKPDPVLSFVADKSLSPDVIICLEQALYIGAIIPMKGDAFNLFANGIIGYRFRLSNWLAPHYRLPLVAGKAANLSRILSNADLDANQFSLGLTHEPIH